MSAVCSAMRSQPSGIGSSASWSARFASKGRGLEIGRRVFLRDGERPDQVVDVPRLAVEAVRADGKLLELVRGHAVKIDRGGASG